MTDVLVVDDSRFMRTVIDNALTEAGYTVETAADGSEAVAGVSRYEPDVITMDVEMPELNGIDATERIMSTHPTPILMLSAHTKPGTDATLEALARGAIDFLHKPDGSDSRNIADLVDDVVESIETIMALDVCSDALARAATTAEGSHSQELWASSSEQPPTPNLGTETSADIDADTDTETTGNSPLLIIGASTGGPKTVERVLRELPRSLEATGIVVQHMPASFTGRFAKRLNTQSEYTVWEAGDGDRIGPGDIVIAPGSLHLEVTQTVGGTERIELRLTDEPPVNGVKPSVDVAMETAAKIDTGTPLIGVILSGMGRDGAAGVEALSEAGGYSIVQNEATSPVFGMPGKAIETGCVDDIRPARELVSGIVAAATTDVDAGESITADTNATADTDASAANPTDTEDEQDE